MESKLVECVKSVFNEDVLKIETKCSVLSEQKKSLWQVAAYTAIFLAAFFIAWNPFFFEHKTFVWQTDGTMQHLPILIYLGRAIRRNVPAFFSGKGLALFDINLGLGGDIIGDLNAMGFNDPLNLISAFVPTRHTEALYGFLAIFRVYLAGLSFLLLCRYFKKPRLHALIGSLVYCFCGYAIFCSMRHPFFVTSMIQLPLLVLGVDKILQKQKPYIFVLSVLYSALSEYYHLYMMTIAISVFALARFFSLYKENRGKEFLAFALRVVFAYILGICLSAVVLLPSIFTFRNAGRNGFHNYKGSYKWPWYRARLLTFVAPPGSWDNMSYAAIVLPALVVLFFNKGRRTLKIVTLFALAFFLTSVGGFVLNGFQYSSNRHTFILSLCVAFCVVETLPELLRLSKKNFILCGIFLAAYTICAFSTAAARKTNYTVLGVAFFSVTLLILLAFKRNGSEESAFKEDKFKLKDCARAFALLTFVLFNVGVNGIYRFASDQGKYSNEFKKFGVETQALHDEVEHELEPRFQKNPEGRLDGPSVKRKSANVWRVPTMVYYNSVTNGNVAELFTKIEHTALSQFFYNRSTCEQTLVTTLLSQKYHSKSDDKKNYIPYGYSFKEKIGGKNFLYQNDFALPWGYTYENAMSYDTLEKLNGLEKQEAMMQAIAINGAEKFQNVELEFARQKIPHQIKCANCEWKNGVLKVDKAKATIKVSFEMPECVEGYLRLCELDSSESGRSDFSYTVKCGDVSRSAHSLGRGYSWYYEHKNHLFNLGYSENARNELVITFPVTGTFKLKDIEVFALPMQNYETQANALRAEVFENIDFGTNKISGTVNLSKDKILCLSVPYSKGWRVTIDGKEEKILCGNYMFVAVPIKRGHHEIVFRYRSPGIVLGAALTGLAILVLATMLLLDRRKIKKAK